MPLSVGEAGVAAEEVAEAGIAVPTDAAGMVVSPCSSKYREHPANTLSNPGHTLTAIAPVPVGAGALVTPESVAAVQMRLDNHPRQHENAVVIRMCRAEIPRTRSRDLCTSRSITRPSPYLFRTLRRSLHNPGSACTASLPCPLDCTMAFLTKRVRTWGSSIRRRNHQCRSRSRVSRRWRRGRGVRLRSRRIRC